MGSSNYKYKSIPIDDVAATYNGYFAGRNDDLDIYVKNRLCYELPKNFFKGDSIRYFRPIGEDIEIANGVWGKSEAVMINAFNRFDENENEYKSLDFIDSKSIIFNGLDLTPNADSSNAIINLDNTNKKNQHIVYIKYNKTNDTITYTKQDSEYYYSNKEEYTTEKNRNLHIIEISGQGQNGGIATLNTDEDGNYYRAVCKGGSGGNSSSACALLIDISKFDEIKIYESNGNVDITCKIDDSNTIVIYTSYHNKCQIRKNNEDVSNLSEYGIYMIFNASARSGGDGKYFEYNRNYNNTEFIENSCKPNEKESEAGSIDINIDLNIFKNTGYSWIKYIKHAGGKSYHDDDGNNAYYSHGAGGGASVYGDGGDGAYMINSSVNLPSDGNGYGAGGGGSGTWYRENADYYCEAGKGGSWLIRVYAETVDGKCDFSANNIKWTKMHK